MPGVVVVEGAVRHRQPGDGRGHQQIESGEEQPDRPGDPVLRVECCRDVERRERLGLLQHCPRDRFEQSGIGPAWSAQDRRARGDRCEGRRLDDVLRVELRARLGHGVADPFEDRAGGDRGRRYLRLVRPEGRHLILLLRVQERLLLGKVVLSAFGREPAQRMAGHEGGRRKISAAVQNETKRLQRKIRRHGIAEVTLGSGTHRSNDGGRIFVVGDDGECGLPAQGVQHLYFSEDLVGGGSADTVNQHVAIVTIDEPRVGFVWIERNQFDFFICGPWT